MSGIRYTCHKEKKYSVSVHFFPVTLLSCTGTIRIKPLLFRYFYRRNIAAQTAGVLFGVVSSQCGGGNSRSYLQWTELNLSAASTRLHHELKTLTCSVPDAFTALKFIRTIVQRTFDSLITDICYYYAMLVY